MSVKVCVIAMLCIVVSSVFKQLRPDMLPFLRIGVTLIICSIAVGVVSPLVVYARSLFLGVGLGEMGDIMLKSLGVAFFAQISADICRDCGEGSAASGVELVAKLEILLLCLPMLEGVLDAAREALSW